MTMQYYLSFQGIDNSKRQYQQIYQIFHPFDPVHEKKTEEPRQIIQTNRTSNFGATYRWILTTGREYDLTSNRKLKDLKTERPCSRKNWNQCELRMNPKSETTRTKSKPRGKGSGMN